MRQLIWKVLWGVAFRLWGAPFRVDGVVPRGPVVFAPNHQSHADTAALQLALARSNHTDVLAGGAEDYFFRTGTVSRLSRLIGVFPFPRQGSIGIERAKCLLAEGTSVILYPQGSRDGGSFKPGVAHLAAEGYPVVPVAIVGTERLLPKGRIWPTRSAVRVTFGEAVSLQPSETHRSFTRRLETFVRSTAARMAA